MTQLGNGLQNAEHYEEALSVQEAELAMLRRLGESEDSVLVTQSNLANTYQALGRLEPALRIRRAVYSGRLKLNGEEHLETLRAARNLAVTLNELQPPSYKEAKALLRDTVPVARRVLGDEHGVTLQMRAIYATALYGDPGATLADLREAVTTLVETTQTARRVLGGAHPLLAPIEISLRNAGAALSGALAARDPPPRGA